MLAEDARDARAVALQEQAMLVQGLVLAFAGKDGPKQAWNAYQEELRRLRGEPTDPKAGATPLAAIMADSYLAALGARIARQAVRRRKRAEAAAQAEGKPDGR